MKGSGLAKLSKEMLNANKQTHTHTHAKMIPKRKKNQTKPKNKHKVTTDEAVCRWGVQGAIFSLTVHVQNNAILSAWATAQ